MSDLTAYLAKRDFDATPEPNDPGRPSGLAPSFSFQKHDATRLHWDLRLEHDGVLLSWAVTRGPSLDTGEKRLAVRTEDHPLSYLDFEGVIPKGSYGAGRVMLWDIGYWQPLIAPGKGLAKGHFHFRLHGRRITGGWHLVKLKPDERRENWLLIKEDDAAANRRDPVRRYVRSVSSGRTMAEIGRGSAPVARPDRTGRAPRWTKPQLATLVDRVESDPGRWHELKFDGYRALVALGSGGPRVFTRNGHDWSDRFASLLPAFDDLACDSVLIDGEIVAGAGLAGFATLQKAIKNGGPFAFQAFDLLHLDGTDLRPLPLHERREALERLFRSVPPLGQIEVSPVIEGDPEIAFRKVCEAGGEGLISKRMDAAYRGGRSTLWTKIKCVRRDEFVVIGWQKSESRSRPFASLLLATADDAGLVYAGKVGTGFDAATASEIAQKLAPLRRKTPAVPVPKSEGRNAVWTTPKLVAEVSFTEMTADGRLRHPSFIGMREDKPVAEVRREVPVNDDRTEVLGVGISSPGRLVFPKAGLTKIDVARYYAEIADRMLETAAERPLSLVRLPDGLEGGRFFQKHPGAGFPDAIRRVPIADSGGEVADHMYVSTAAGLVSAAQMGALEFHVWGARRDRIEKPDRMVFDLDPDEALDWAEVVGAAEFIRDRLDEIGLPSWPLVSGGKGIHVVVELRRVAGWDTVSLFSKTFAVATAAAAPERLVATMSKAKRKGRIFIDWLRNERGATAIAPFSLRARPGAPVATPVRWSELPHLKSAADFTSEAALERMWSDAPRSPAKAITSSVIERLERQAG